LVIMTFGSPWRQLSHDHDGRSRGLVDQWAEKVAAEAGFTAMDHTVELSGLCPGCTRGRAPSRRR